MTDTDERENLPRLVWQSCSMVGEGVLAHGVGQGVDRLDHSQHYVISANGVDYEVVVVRLDMPGGWEVIDIGSFEARYRIDPESGGQ